MLARAGRYAALAPDTETARQLSQKTVIDLGGIPELGTVSVRGKRVTLGTGATLGRALIELSERNGLIRQAISMTANPLVRNRITLMEALAPDSTYFDLATALLALDSKVRVQSVSGSRILGMADYLLEVAGDPPPGQFPAAVEFSDPGEEFVFGFFRVNPGPSKNTVSAAVVTRLRRNVAVGPAIYVSSSTLIPVHAPRASAEMTRSLLNDRNVKRIAETAAAEMMELTEPAGNAYESSLIEVAVSRALRRLTETGSPG
jgi:CO/xanthine dehydrogenase FAD-binding subunit